MQQHPLQPPLNIPPVMALATAISHMQLALGHLKAVLQSHSPGEDDQRHLQELTESVVRLCDRHVHHTKRQGTLTPRGRFAELRPSFKPAESSMSLQDLRQVVEMDEALGSMNFMQNPQAAEARDLRRFSDAASEASGASGRSGLETRPRTNTEASDASEDRSSISESIANHDYVGQDTEGLEPEQELKVPTRVRRALNAQRNVLLNLFNKLDTDKSGVLEADELKSALRAVGQHPQRAEKLIAAADENCNGKVEIHEWIHVVDRLVAGKGGAVMENFTKALVKADYGNNNNNINLRDARSYTWTWDDKPWYWMISGQGTFRLCWDILLFCLLVYVAVVMPYTLAYLPESDFQNGMNVFMTSCFCFDILLNFRTTFLDEAGEEVRSPCLVGKQYLRSWFLLDFVTAVPFEQVTDAISAESVGGLKLLRTSKIFKILRVVRAIKLWKILRASELGSILEDFVMHSNSGRRAFELFRILVACCLLCHLLACFMHISGSGFLETYEWTGDSAASQYICSLYWAMTTVTTVGYGDIIPRSDGERIFTMAAMIIGGAFYGYVVGNISVILASNDVNWRAHKERLDLIESWISHHRFPAQLRRKIWAFYKKAVSGQVVWDDGVVFAELTVELREEVASYLIHPELQKNLVFRGVPQSVMIRIVGILQQINVKKGEPVVPFGSFSFGMFILLDGAAILEKDVEPFEVNDFSRDLLSAHHVTSAEGGKKLTELLRRSDSFGEEVLLGLRAQYEYSVTPQRRTVMLLLPRDQFMERLSGMPEVFTIMRTNFTT
eukprot:s8_g39.t1